MTTKTNKILNSGYFWGLIRCWKNQCIPETNNKIKFEITKMSLKTKEKKTPVIINIAVNVFITFGLSLSIYLLIANIFLTVHKLGIQTSIFSSIKYQGANPFTFTPESNSELYNTVNIKYYDCSISILSPEECDLINQYHDHYLNSVRMGLFVKQSEKNVETRSLKVNTSFFIH